MNYSKRIFTPDELRTEANSWPALVPFGRARPPALDLAMAIPEALAPFRDFILATAEAIQVSVDGVATLALALASIGTARAVEIEPKPGWRETAPLWCAVLGLSGERKSALVDILGEPIYQWQDDEHALLKHALAAYDERRNGITARLSGIRDKLKREADDAKAKKLSDEACGLRAELENLPELHAPNLIIGTATPEGLRDGLIQNGEKLLWLSDEASAEDLLGSRYAKGGGNDIDLPLKCYTGMPHNVGRAGGRSMTLKRPALTLALCVQPAALAGVLRDAAANDKGFVPRLCVVHPGSLMGSRALNPADVPNNLKEWWRRTLRRLLDLPWPGRVVLNAGGPTRYESESRVLCLTAEAKIVFDVLRAEVEGRLGPDGDLRPICGFGSKLPGVIARIALVFEAMQDPAAPVVRAETMQAACAWAPFLIAHFRAALGDASEPPESRHARRLIDALRRRDDRETTARDCFRLIDNPTDVTSMEDFKPVLEILEERNYLRLISGRPEADKGRGRPASPRYEVNPVLFSAS